MGWHLYVDFGGSDVEGAFFVSKIMFAGSSVPPASGGAVLKINFGLLGFLYVV